MNQLIGTLDRFNVNFTIIPKDPNPIIFMIDIIVQVTTTPIKLLYKIVTILSFGYFSIALKLKIQQMFCM